MNHKALLTGSILIIIAVSSVYVVATPLLKYSENETASPNSRVIENNYITNLATGTPASNVESTTTVIGEFLADNLATGTEPMPPSEVTFVPPPIPETKIATHFTLADIANHSTENDCWTAVNGVVYDLTSFIVRHPGGKANIARMCGVDGTAAFERQHAGQGRPENTLAGLEIGVLK